MALDENIAIVSEDFADIIIDYRGAPRQLEGFDDAFIHIMNDTYAVIHMPITGNTLASIRNFGYAYIPAIYGLTSDVSIGASGVNTLRNLSGFNLLGNGVLVGIVDTGIDYMHPALRKGNGTTKIYTIWDQNIQTMGRSPFNTGFGTEYTSEQINQAIASDNPFETVPSTDENGHGTMLAGVAVGASNEEVNFQGVAPAAELVVVKLKESKKFMRELFLIPDDVISYQENHIMWAVQYCVQVAAQANRPIVICLALGSSQTSHEGRSHLGNYISGLADRSGVGVAISVGNEGNMGRHFYGVIDPQFNYTNVELNIGENDKNFFMELWGAFPGIYSIDIMSPEGEYIPRIPAGIRTSREISFIFSPTTILIDYQLVEALSGDQLILIRFINASPGIWHFRVFEQANLTLGFNIWLPMGNFISSNTYFIQPNIYTTVLDPASSLIPLAVTAYNPVNENLFVNSSRGFTSGGGIKPELAAPGVNYMAPALNNSYQAYTGTGVAAAHSTGIMALLMEWAVVRGNYPIMDSVAMKGFLIRGARRRTNLQYPNRDWGYGILDIFGTFNILRGV